jgi:hypothetical protein
LSVLRWRVFLQSPTRKFLALAKVRMRVGVWRDEPSLVFRLLFRPCESGYSQVGSAACTTRCCCVHHFLGQLTFDDTAAVSHHRTIWTDILPIPIGRTGTDSLRQALVTLGFGPAYHMREVRPMMMPTHTPRHLALTGSCTRVTAALAGSFRRCRDQHRWAPQVLGGGACSIAPASVI